MEAGWILRMNSVSSYFACCIFHIIRILFNCISDTAIRVAKAMMGAKVVSVFHVCVVSRISRYNSCLGSSAFSHLVNRAEISHTNPRRN